MTSHSIELTDKYTGFKEIFNMCHIIRVTENQGYCHVYCIGRKYPMVPSESYAKVSQMIKEFS